MSIKGKYSSEFKIFLLVSIKYVVLLQIVYCYILVDSTDLQSTLSDFNSNPFLQKILIAHRKTFVSRFEEAIKISNGQLVSH